MNLIVLLLVMVRICLTIGFGVSKVSYILGYNYKNLRLKVSYKWFLKRENLLYHLFNLSPLAFDFSIFMF